MNDKGEKPQGLGDLVKLDSEIPIRFGWQNQPSSAKCREDAAGQRA
jgi:hypothetical protein